jgi:hypothetical protein
MKVVLTTDRVCGYGALQRQGAVIDVNPEEALRLIQAGQAEAFQSDEVIETAMVEPREEIRRTRSNKHATPVK